jgi:hypothetical protein
MLSKVKGRGSDLPAENRRLLVAPLIIIINNNRAARGARGHSESWDQLRTPLFRFQFFVRAAFLQRDRGADSEACLLIARLAEGSYSLIVKAQLSVMNRGNTGIRDDGIRRVKYTTKKCGNHCEISCKRRVETREAGSSEYFRGCAETLAAGSFLADSITLTR